MSLGQLGRGAYDLGSGTLIVLTLDYMTLKWDDVAFSVTVGLGFHIESRA